MRAGAMLSSSTIPRRTPREQGRGRHGNQSRPVAVDGIARPALWQHPPVRGESIVEFHVPVPAGVRNLRLRFSIGIRDGSQGAEQLVAFRVKVDGWQVWSRADWPRRWAAAEIALPFQAGNMLRLAFATDALGSHQWSWAAWAEPELVGRLES